MIKTLQNGQILFWRGEVVKDVFSLIRPIMWFGEMVQFDRLLATLHRRCAKSGVAVTNPVHGAVRCGARDGQGLARSLHRAPQQWSALLWRLALLV